MSALQNCILRKTHFRSIVYKIYLIKDIAFEAVMSLCFFLNLNDLQHYTFNLSPLKMLPHSNVYY